MLIMSPPLNLLFFLFGKSSVMIIYNRFFSYMTLNL
nr:MAG TPA: hypothetical protein [Bacteriophage sp.]DAX07495.1 MAG TPA: hypothetical protein [Bacteriophage sp.]